MKKILPLFLLAAFCITSHAEIRTTPRDIFNARYGEIVVVTGGPFSFTGHVYNTLGLNDCPEALWQKLDPKLLKKQYKARSVILNGPRYFVMDRVSLANPGAVSDFQGLKARHLANVSISLMDVLRGEGKNYTDNTVARTTDYTYNKGRTIYTLTSPDGRKYVMQSYSRIVDPKLKKSDLANLGQRLKLPPGWTYKAVKLSSPLVLKATGTAYVLQDDLKNSYQRADSANVP